MLARECRDLCEEEHKNRIRVDAPQAASFYVAGIRNTACICDPTCRSSKELHSQRKTLSAQELTANGGPARATLGRDYGMKLLNLKMQRCSWGGLSPRESLNIKFMQRKALERIRSVFRATAVSTFSGSRRGDDAILPTLSTTSQPALMLLPIFLSPSFSPSLLPSVSSPRYGTRQPARFSLPSDSSDHQTSIPAHTPTQPHPIQVHAHRSSLAPNHPLLVRPSVGQVGPGRQSESSMCNPNIQSLG